MTRSRTRLFALVASFAGLAAASPLPALAQEGGDDVMLDLRFGGIADIEPHEKDAAAYEAVMMLGERLAELPEELQGPQEARDVLELIWEIARGGIAFRATSKHAGDLAFGLTLEPAEPITGQDLFGRMLPMPLNFGGPIMWPDTNPAISLPYGNAYFHVHEPDASGQTYLELICDTTNEIQKGDAPFAPTDVRRFGLPGNAAPLLSGEINLARFSSFVIDENLGGDLGPFTDLLNDHRWVIDEAPLVDFAYGNDAEYQYITSRTHNGKDWLAKLGMDPDVTITSDQYADVPVDATTLYIVPFSLDFLLSIVDQLAEAEGEDPFGELEDALGFDVRGDVLENLGPRITYYQSLSTGGGGLTSAVMICELQDAERLASTHEELRHQLNEVLDEQARGYVRVRSWEAAGHEVFSFTTPGIPLPFEPSWSIAGDSLVLAASPVGIVAALDQMNTDGSSVSDSPVFKAAMAGILPEDDVSTVTFSDTEWFARQGYSTSNFMTSALANAVRSPSDPSRDAGLLMPGYQEFTSGIQPMGAVEYWDGDDYVTMMRMDGSVLVEVAEFSTQMGGIRGVAAAAALQAGILLPALGKARASAKQLKSATQVRSLGQAIVIYGDVNNGEVPPSYDALVDEGYITHEMLVSPFGPSYDGRGDIVMRTTLPAREMYSYKASVIVAIDRAMYVNGEDIVNVGFADNHVDVVSYWELDEMLDEPQNEGAREDFMLD